MKKSTSEIDVTYFTPVFSGPILANFRKSVKMRIQIDLPIFAKLNRNSGYISKFRSGLRDSPMSIQELGHLSFFLCTVINQTPEYFCSTRYTYTLQ